MIFKEWRKKLLTILIEAGIFTLIGILYTAFFKQETDRGFAFDLADVLFIWGLTLLCFSLIYVTRYFGYYDYMRKMFSFRPFRKGHADDEEETKLPATDDSEEHEKRDSSLVFASLIVVALSFLLALL